MKKLEELVQVNQESFRKFFHLDADFTVAAPGRINIIGEHTDYNQGLSMPAGINRWVLCSCSKRKDKKVVIYSLNYHSEFSFDLGEKLQKEESWQRYIYGCIEVFRSTFSIEVGFNAVINGNVPIGSGVSSSAAIEVSIMNALRNLYNVELSDLELIKLCQKVEHEHLKINSGLLDQYASQFSNEGSILMLDFKELSHKYIPASFGEWIWVLVDTKVKRELAGSKYSERVEETLEGYNLLKEKFQEVNHFRDIELHHLESLGDNLLIKKRLNHFVKENQRVLEAANCISKGDFLGLGSLLVESHESLSKDYEVSCEELDFLVQRAIDFEGCAGGRMMGGGFGGCTINLVKKDEVDKFSQKIANDYFDKFNIEPEITIYKVVRGAHVVDY